MASGSPRRAGTRRLITASLLLGIFVLFDLGLLGWLIFRSLSRREVEQTLLETRQEAEKLADEIAGTASEGGKDLYTLIAVEREKQTYLDKILQGRDIVQTVEIRDAEGRLVFRALAEKFDPPRAPEGPRLEQRELEPRVETSTVERTETVDYDMEVPIGELGILRIGISQAEMQRRIELLRGELVRQTVLIGAVTLGLLLLAYLTIWWLWKRSRRLEEQASEAERMAYIGTLASGLAHEIRNPLNSLNLNMQLLQEEAQGGASADSTRRLLALTRQEIDRLERLVTDFLSYAKPGPLELQEVTAVDLMRRCRELMAGELETRRARVIVEDLSGGARVRVDPGQITQLLLNLVHNALTATEESGRPPRLVLATRSSGGRVFLEVEDNGIGISPEVSGRIFELFFSTRKGGTGLGLAVVQRIARAHGGEVEVGSTPGVGTRVRVSLPEVPPVAEEAPVERAVETSARA